jgi:hypothetical protein
MDSRSRLQKTLTHQIPDRIPIDLGGTGVTGIHVKVVENLRNHLGLDWEPVKVVEPFQMLGEIDEDLTELMGIDVVGLYGKKNMFGIENHNWKEYKTWWGQIVRLPGDFNTKPDNNGNLYIHPEGDESVEPSAVMPIGSYFFNAIIRQQPLNDETLDPADNLEEFGIVSIEDLDWFASECSRLAKTRKGIIASFGGTGLGDIALVPGLQLKHPKGIRDVQEWYLSTLMRQDYIHQVFEKQTDIAIENLEKIHQRIGNKIDAIFICGTDFGTQSGQFCSPETFINQYQPYYKKVNDWIHKNTSWKTFKHSCGAIIPFMESFIEAGFDIINPVQINAKEMAPEFLKKQYGEKIIFWGGGVDTQKILPFGTPEEVIKQVTENCRVFGENGGFVFNTVHNIQANVPVENVMAMLEGLRIFNGNV